MKFRAFVIAALLALNLNAGEWDDFSARLNRTKRDLALFDGKTRKGSVRDFQKSGLVGASVKDGMLVLDASRFLKEFPGKTLDFYYFLTPVPGKNVVLEVELAGPDGASVDLLFEGRTDKHYWKKKSVSLKPEPSLYRMETKLPDHLKSLAFRITFRDIPQLKIGRIFFGVKEDGTKVDARANHISNGGAERGFYNVYPPSAVRIAKPGMNVAIDGKEFHSGRHSFRLDPVRDGFNRLVFNAVPYIVGKPIVFSMYMKAAKPDTPVDIGLFSAHGSAYHKTVRVGTEWKKYELSVPAFGGDAPGIRKFGNPAMTSDFSHVSPIVTPSGRVWLDDAVCQLAAESTDVPSPAIALSGKLETEYGYLYAGNPFRGTIRLDSPDEKTCRLTWELLDWRGGRILAGEFPEKITLPGEKKFSISPPDGALGPMNLIFTAETESGKRHSHTFYTGVLRSPGKSLRRWGTNVHVSPADYAFTARLFRDFGIGAVRLWAKTTEKDRGGFNSASAFHDAGFLVMMNISGVQPGSSLYISRDSRSIITGYFKEAILRNRGKVDIYELFNEPEIWAGRTPNPDPANYVAATAESCAAATLQMAKAIRELDPHVKIAGPGCHIKPDFLYAWLKAGAAETLDYLTEHPYRQLPEMPDLETVQADFQAVLKKFRPDLPILSSESGNVNFPTFPDNRIHPVSCKLAARDLRYALIEFACGIRTYFHFQAAGIDIGYAWTSVLGDPDHHWVPGLYLYAVRNAADLLGEASVACRVGLGGNKRCYIYDTGSRRVAVLWQWNGTPETLEFSRPAAFYDWMGNRFRTQKLKLDEYPVYLESSLSTAELKQFIASAKQTGIEKPLEYTVELCGKHSFGIRLNNVTSQTLTGSVECAGQIQPFKIYGEKSALLQFKSPAPVTLNPQKLTMKLRIKGFRDAEHKIRVKGITVPESPHEIRIDGDLSDWPENAAEAVLDEKNSRRLFPWTEADRKNRAEIRFSWTSSALFIAVTVYKTAFHPEEKFGKPAIWRGDSLQIGIDTMKNAAAETKGLQSDDFEYLIGEFQKKPLVWRLKASSASWDSFGKATGEVNDVKLAIRHLPGKTIYEMAFSPIAVSPFRLTGNSGCRLTVLVNFSDGTKRIGWLQLSPGMGDMPHRPAEFMDIILQK